MKAIIAIALCFLAVSVDAGASFNCKNGPANKFPKKDESCYAVDEGRARALKNSCEGYLVCIPDSCRWTKQRCPEGQAWSQNLEKCVSLGDADCGPAIFGKKAKVVIRNEKYEKVLDDCRTCTEGDYFLETTSVIGYFNYSSLPWNQVLVAKQRSHRPYYSLAFSRYWKSLFKVIYADPERGVVSKIFRPSMHEGTEWRFVPIENQPKSFLIVSVLNGKALAMSKNPHGSDIYDIELQRPDPSNEAQRWTLHNGSGKAKKDGDDDIVHGKCSSGPSLIDPVREKYPTPDSKCYSEDLNHLASAPANCQQYLYCNPSECRWRSSKCTGGSFWSNLEQTCVPAPKATCGGTLFGREKRVQIVNVEYEKVLEDCRNCGNSTDWKAETPVIGSRKNSNPEWYQVLIAKRRDNDPLYSLAFDMGNQDGTYVKVVTDNGEGTVMSTMYSTARSEPAQWRFVPIPGQKNRIQIISTFSNLAMAMGRVEGEKEFFVRVTQPNALDKRQQWVVQEVEGNPLTVAVNATGNQQQWFEQDYD